jgi:hypothetical protein
MVRLALLRVSAMFLLVGLVLSDVMQILHPGGGSTYEATFIYYAASSDWMAVHLGQYVAEAILLAGLLFLYFALNLTEGTPRWLGFFGATAIVVTLALYAVLQAVDGVALKQAVDAWATAPTDQQGTRLAGAEAIRWLEFGVNSYWNLMRGIALLLLGGAIVWTARVPRPVGLLMSIAGLAFIVLGWQVGTQGFTSAGALPTQVGYLAFFALAIWLLVASWLRKEPVKPAVE